MKIKIFLLAFLLLNIIGGIAYAQYEFVPDLSGKPLTDSKYVNLTGTPFFIDQWVSGDVKLADGKLVKPTELKYDMVEDKLLFKAEGKTFEFYPPVLSFKLNTADGVKTFVKKDQIAGNGSYFQLLNQGKVKLLKKNYKNILEVKGYNSATVEKTVDENKKYYVVNNDKTIEVKLNKKSFLEALPEFKDKISALDVKITKQNAEQVFIDLTNSF